MDPAGLSGNRPQGRTRPKGDATRVPLLHFSEKVYEYSLAIELRKAGLQVVQQLQIKVFYDGQVVGRYDADLCVNNVVLIELKAARQLIEEHEALLLNDLKATRFEVGLLLNFGPSPEVKRRVYDNERKGALNWLGPRSGRESEE